MVRVALLEPGVLGRLGRQPFQQDVDGPDQPGQLLRLDGLLAGDVGGALGEEVQDVQRGGVQQPLVQQRAALAEPVRGQGHAGAQLAGEALGAEPHGLVVLDVISPSRASVRARASLTAAASAASTGSSPGPAEVSALRTSSPAILSTSSGVTFRFSPRKDTSADIRTGRSTSPAPGPSRTKSRRTSGTTALDATRAPSAVTSTMLRA